MQSRSFAVLLLLLLLLFSCSTRPSEHDMGLPEHTIVSNSLNRIVIRSFWSEKFSGLLALSRDGTSLSYSLLDHTGVTLLSAKVAADATTSNTRGIQKLQDSSLPKLLATALSRIYLVGGSERCGGLSPADVCKKTVDADTGIKYSPIGPFTLWKVKRESDRSEDVYVQPWIGLSITLTAVDGLH